MNRSREVLIRRTGDAPLQIIGYGLAAQATSHTQQGTRSSRWHELELWSHDERLTGPEQRHCIVVRYRTQWQGELGHHWAQLVLRRDVAATLRAYDPLEHVLGYPPGEQFRARDERMRREIVAGWEHAVSDLLEQAAVWELGELE